MAHQEINIFISADNYDKNLLNHLQNKVKNHGNPEVNINLISPENTYYRKILLTNGLFLNDLLILSEDFLDAPDIDDQFLALDHIFLETYKIFLDSYELFYFNGVPYGIKIKDCDTDLLDKSIEYSDEKSYFLLINKLRPNIGTFSANTKHTSLNTFHMLSYLLEIKKEYVLIHP